MAKITKLGRVVGSRWYTGTNYNEIKLPLENDMFLKSDTLEFFQYKNNEWIYINKFSTDNYIVAENVETAQNLNKSIKNIPLENIFSFENFGQGEVITSTVLRAKEADSCSNSIYSQFADNDELGNRIIETYATKKEINNLIGIDHSLFATQKDLLNVDMKVENIEKNIENGTILSGSITTDTCLIPMSGGQPVFEDAIPLYNILEMKNNFPTGKVLYSVKADSVETAKNVGEKIMGMYIRDIFVFDEGDNVTPVVYDSNQSNLVKGNILHHIDVENLVGDSINEIKIEESGLYSCSIYRRGLPDFKFTALISIFKDANSKQFFDFEQNVDDNGYGHLTPTGWLEYNNLEKKLYVKRNEVAQTYSWSYSFYDIRMLTKY